MRTDYNLKEVTLQAFEEFILINEHEANAKPNPEKWSPKEIMGHLIDSATNNHGRFIRAQFSDDLMVTMYLQDDWVRFQDYQSQNWQDLLITWRQLNLLISNVMFNTSPETRDKERAKHNLHQTSMKPVADDDSVSLGFFMNDYVEHMKHHLGQIRVILNTL